MVLFTPPPPNHRSFRRIQSNSVPSFGTRARETPGRGLPPAAAGPHVGTSLVWRPRGSVPLPWWCSMCSMLLRALLYTILTRKEEALSLSSPAASSRPKGLTRGLGALRALYPALTWGLEATMRNIENPFTVDWWQCSSPHRPRLGRVFKASAISHRPSGVWPGVAPESSPRQSSCSPSSANCGLGTQRD